MTSLGLEARDFDAFVRKKWKSNAYTLERRTARDKLLIWARHAQQTYGALTEGLELTHTEDVPSVSNGREVRSLRVYWVRPAPLRAGLKELLQTDLAAGTLFQIAVHQQHAHVGLEIAEDGLSVRLSIPPGARVDRSNLEQKLALDWIPEEWPELVAGLPDEARFGLEGETRPIHAWDPAELATLAGGLARGPDFGVWWTLGREEASAADGELFIEPLAACLRLHRFFAWSKDNDHSPLEVAVEKQLEAAVERSPGFSPGDRVTILGGLFAGRAGYLAEVDAKGKAKVMVGPISVSVPVDELKEGG